MRLGSCRNTIWLSGDYDRKWEVDLNVSVQVTHVTSAHCLLGRTQLLTAEGLKKVGECVDVWQSINVPASLLGTFYHWSKAVLEFFWVNTVKIFYPRSVGRPVTRLLELLLNLRLPDTTCHEVFIYLFIFIFLGHIWSGCKALLFLVVAYFCQSSSWLWRTVAPKVVLSTEQSQVV